ncbi:MAG: TRAP transporter substrate-binding protein [Candidatus Velthaea sp.]
MKMNRARFTAATAAAFATVAFLRYPAGAAEFTFKFANDNPDSHPENIRMRAAAERIRIETNGRFEMQVFSNGQLGGDTGMLTQLRSGAIQFLGMPDIVLANVVPLASIVNVGFAFEDSKHVWSALDGELGALVRADIAKSGIYAFERGWNNGFRNITTSTKPIVSPADLATMKIRVPQSPLAVSMFRALGASPTGINFNEAYTALQTRVVDGQENALALIETARLYEVQKYCSLTKHQWSGYWFLANLDAWNRVPKGIRDVVERIVGDAALLERGDIDALTASLQPKLTGQGLVFNSPDREPFRNKLREAGFYSDWKTKFGERAWSTLERYTGKMA